MIKSINALKGRNAIVIAPHPRAKFFNMTIVEKMRGALKKMGAPADLVQTMAQPSLGKTEELWVCNRSLPILSCFKLKLALTKARLLRIV